MNGLFRLKNFILHHVWAAGLLFLLLFFAAPLRANAAVAVTDVDIDYKNEIVYVKKNDNASLYYVITAAGKTSDKYTPAPHGAGALHKFGEEDCEYFMIDLSVLKAAKASSLFLCNDVKETPLKIDIPAQKTLKAAYTGIESRPGEFESLYADFPGITLETGYFLFTVNNSTLTDVSLVRWKAGASTNYREMSELNLEIYTGAGATLYFQYADGITPLSKAVKVKIKKPANAPKVKIDGAKHTIAIKSNMQYRVITEDYVGYWIQPDTDIKSLKLSELVGLTGEGIYTSFGDAVIEVRVAATAKAHSSNIARVYLDSVEEPVFGEDGITVGFTKGTDDKNGLTIKNNSNVEYQVAVVEKGAWGTTSVKQLIMKVDGTAKKGETGYIPWKKVAASKSVKIAYKDYSGFDDYVIIARRSTVKENTKTTAREFRVASVIRPFGGIVPTPDVKPGTYVISEAKDVEITFATEEGFTLYTAVGNGELTRNETGKVTFNATAGNSYTVKAYYEDDGSGEKSDVVTLVYRYVNNDELDDYKDAWGYNYYIKLDKKNGNRNDYQILYQRVYLGFLTYNANVNFADLQIETGELSKLICAVWADNPQLIQAKTGLRYTSTSLTLNLNNRELCERLYTQCEKNFEEIVDIIKEKYGSLESASKVQKVKEIHDYLVLKKEYKSSAMSQTMAGSLADEYTPVCMSYTLAMKWCCNKLGIQCEIIFGDAGELHAWNIINYGDNVDYSAAEPVYNTTDWYEMDVTWDDPIGPAESYIGRDYFNVTTEYMKKSRTRLYTYYKEYPVENCTGTELSWDNIKNDF